MNPIHVNCPECQKLFMVLPEDLSEGLARFCCTQCESYFAFRWPQPPGTDRVRAQMIDSEEFEKAPMPPAVRATKACPRCARLVEATRDDCSYCGVVFNKLSSLKKAASPVTASPELEAAWKNLKQHYLKTDVHERFLKLCYEHESLPFASSCYRVILEANPHDEIAKSMQNRVIELATLSYVATAQPAKAQGKRRSWLRWSFHAFALVLAITCVTFGFALRGARPMIAVGFSVLVFSGTLNYMGRRSQRLGR